MKSLPLRPTGIKLQGLGPSPLMDAFHREGCRLVAFWYELSETLPPPIQRAPGSCHTTGVVQGRLFPRRPSDLVLQPLSRVDDPLFRFVLRQKGSPRLLVFLPQPSFRGCGLPLPNLLLPGRRGLCPEPLPSVQEGPFPPERPSFQPLASRSTSKIDSRRLFRWFARSMPMA